MPDRHESAQGIQETIRHLWFARKVALEASDLLGAQGRVEELRAFMRQEGITADRSISRGFAYEGYENLREGNYERARSAFDLARTFDPFLPQAQLGYAWSQLRSGRGVFTFLDEYAKGIKLSFSRLLTDEIMISNLAIIVTLSILISLTIFSLFVIARCQGRVRHEIFEALRRLMPDPAARFASWVFFLLPLLAWVGGIWLILYWLVICFRHMRPAEKLVALGVFLMIGLSPMGVGLAIDRFESSTDPELTAVLSASQQGYNPATLERLEQVAQAHAKSPELHLLLGTLYAKGDLQGKAFDTYSFVLKQRPTSVPAMINIGNVYFRLGEYSQAVGRYKQALDQEPNNVSAYWNLYLAQTELLHFAEAEASLARARELDDDRVGELLAQKKEAGAGQLIQEGADLSRIKTELRRDRGQRDRMGHALANPVSMASGGALLLALLLVFGSRHVTTECCSRCGRPFCDRCRVESSRSDFCPRCVHILIKRNEVTAGVLQQETLAIERRDRLNFITRHVLSLVLPGSGLIMSGRVALGVPIMMGWVFTVLSLLMRGELLLGPRVPVTDFPPVGLVIGSSMAIILWIGGNILSMRNWLMMETRDGA